MPDGVPSSEVGSLELNLTGPQVYQQFRQEQWGTTCAAAGSYTLGSGTVGLTTTGMAPSCAQLVSPTDYTYGIFQATVWIPGAANGLIANWPAFWLDSANLAAWPQGGEWDLMEGLAGYDASHYHYGTLQDPLSVRFPSSGQIPGSGPGWHTITGVWDRGVITEYLDGTEVFSWNSSNVVNTPMMIVLSMDSGQYGYTTNAPSTMLVKNVSVWGVR